mgnify:CR=1 FL=1
MKLFKNIKEAHYYYKFPGSYRIGTIIKDNIVIRVYSNGISAPDYFIKNNNEFFYFIKNEKIFNAFKNTKKNKKYIYLFARINRGVNFYGVYKIKGFRENNKYVLLEKYHI